MSELSWVETKRQVAIRAKDCCEYCYTCEYNTGQPMHVEHIDPNGGDGLENLCLSCASCNLSKAAATIGIDPTTHTSTAIFNPRTQIWSEHFEWIDNRLRILGKTPTGRATIERLKMNQERMLRARHNWIKAGNHPPT